ncbi:MAG: cation:proton antiporter [Bacteroidota bacterium]|nr:cation:proton antiporter [Bacteroidota bacterium]
MTKFKSAIFYVLVIGGFLALMYWIVQTGKPLEVGKVTHAVQRANESDIVGMFKDSITLNVTHPLAILILQIITIVFTARFCGFLFNKIGQPSVIGEVVAGIILGPSILGMWFPGYTEFLFPKTSLPNLQYFSQVGLILFMFVVGMELDLKVLKMKARDAIVISHASIIVPYALGMGLAYFIYSEFASANTNFLSFSLFLGISMSITAFPVLARIIQERGMTKTKLGAVAITCAAADDITAWCILASVIAIVKAGSFWSSLFTIALAIGYVIAMLKLVKPFINKLGEVYSNRESLSLNIVATIFGVLLISSYATEVIGIHALFGAFLAGVIMPPKFSFRKILIEKVEYVALGLLLPLFFAFSGLRTQIGLLNDGHSWGVCMMIISVAVVGKFGGSMFAAKFMGQSWKDSLSIGALMNTRGLMELIVLNIGYDLGVISPTVFAMMVIMALVTTFMTGPALDLINYLFKTKSEGIPQEIKEISKYKILLAIGNPESGRTLLRLANSLTKRMNGNAALTAMHLSPANELYPFNADEYEEECFAPVIEESQNLNRKITTLFKASNDIDSDIADLANKGDYDLLLIGLGQSIFEGSLLGKVLGFTTRIINPEKLLNTMTRREKLFDNSPFDERTKSILSKTQVSVGILVDKKLTSVGHVFIPLFDTKDSCLITYAQRLIHNNEAQIVVLDAVGQIKNNPETKEKIRKIEQNAPNHITLQNEKAIEKTFLQQQDLMIISLESWKKLVETKSLWLSDIPSTLIISDNREALN